MNRSLTIILALVLLILGAASARILLGWPVSHPSVSAPAAPATSDTVAAATDTESPASSPMSDDGPSQKKPDVRTPSAEVTPATPQPSSSEGQVHTDRPAEVTARDDRPQLTSEIRKELIRRYLEALNQLRD